MTDTVIITGRDIEVDHQAHGQPDPKRRRPVAYNPPESTVDLGDTIVAAGHCNPHWSDEANDYADAHPELRPKDLAYKFRHYRIENNHG